MKKKKRTCNEEQREQNWTSFSKKILTNINGLRTKERTKEEQERKRKGRDFYS
jgi:hypothetical protein